MFQVEQLQRKIQQRRWELASTQFISVELTLSLTRLAIWTLTVNAQMISTTEMTVICVKMFSLSTSAAANLVRFDINTGQLSRND